jgi:transglutaminase-like putative cysteine protease
MTKTDVYTFQYTFTFDPWILSEDECLEMMIPIPVSDGRQIVGNAQVYPNTYRFHQDDLGNKIAFLQLHAGETLTVKADVRIELFNFTQSKLNTVLPLSKDIVSEVLVPISDDIKKLALELTAKAQNDEEKAFLLFQFVRDNLTYKYPPVARGAQETLERREGDCGEFSALYNALCRSIKIPSRLVYGWFVAPWYIGAHAWSEVWLEEHGWIPVDTSVANNMGDFSSILRTLADKDFFFGNLSQYHFTFSRGTGLDWIGATPTVKPPSENQEFIIDGRPFAFWEELYDGKIPYLQLPYMIISNVKRGQASENFYRVSVKPQFFSRHERFNALVDSISSRPLYKYIAFAVAFSAGFLPDVTHVPLANIGLLIITVMYVLWFLTHMYSDIRLAAVAKSKVALKRHSLSVLMSWAIYGFFGFRLIRLVT